MTAPFDIAAARALIAEARELTGSTAAVPYYGVAAISWLRGKAPLLLDGYEQALAEVDRLKAQRASLYERLTAYEDVDPVTSRPR